MNNKKLLWFAPLVLLSSVAGAASVGAPGTPGQIVINNGGNLGTANTPTAIDSLSNGNLYAATTTAATAIAPAVTSPSLGLTSAWWTGSSSLPAKLDITFLPSTIGYTTGVLQFALTGDNTGPHEVRFTGAGIYADFVNQVDQMGAFQGAGYHTAQFGLYNLASTTQGIVPSHTAVSLLGLTSNGVVETLRNVFGALSPRNILDDGTANANMALMGGLVVGVPTGGNKGVGTVNATNLYINGVAVTSGGGGSVSSVANSDSTLTVSPTTGSVVASINTGHRNTWTASQVVAVTVGGTQTAGGTLTPNFALSNSLTATFGSGNLTIANPSGMVAGQTYQIALTQDGTGSRTVSWGSYFKWAGGTAPTLSTAASAKDIITCWADTATTLVCNLAIANAH